MRVRTGGSGRRPRRVSTTSPRPAITAGISAAVMALTTPTSATAATYHGSGGTPCGMRPSWTSGADARGTPTSQTARPAQMRRPALRRRRRAPPPRRARCGGARPRRRRWRRRDRARAAGGAAAPRTRVRRAAPPAARRARAPRRRAPRRAQPRRAAESLGRVGIGGRPGASPCVEAEPVGAQNGGGILERPRERPRRRADAR